MRVFVEDGNGVETILAIGQSPGSAIRAHGHDPETVTWTAKKDDRERIKELEARIEELDSQ